MFEKDQTFDMFLKDYYGIGYNNFMKVRSAQRVAGLEETILGDEEIRKIVTADESNWYHNAYMRNVQMQFPFYSDIYKVLDKRPLASVGDSYKYAEAHGLTEAGIQPGGATALFTGSETETTLSTIEKILSPITKITLVRDLHSMLHERLPEANATKTDWNWMTQKTAPKELWSYIDKWLGGYEIVADEHGVDSPAGTQIECIDRMISNGVESGAANHVSAATDGDIFWNGLGTGTAKIDRSTGDTWADCFLKLPAAAGTEENFAIVEELEDLMRQCKPYSERKRYICLTTGATYNKIIDEEGGALSYDEDMGVKLTVNGLSTTPGKDVNMAVRSIWLSGIRVPLFTSEMLPGENTVYTTPTSGHAYLIDLDHLYIRVDLPVTYLETGFGVEMLHQDYARSRAMLFTVANLVCDKFKCHAALKWIAA